MRMCMYACGHAGMCACASVCVHGYMGAHVTHDYIGAPQVHAVRTYVCMHACMHACMHGQVPWLPASHGQRSRALVELVDIYKTICDVMGLPLPDDTIPIEGVTLIP